MIRVLGLALLLCAPALAADPGADAAQAYRLDTSGSTSSLGVGETGKLVLVIRPRAPAWHVHPQAPLKVRFEIPPNLKIEKPDLTRKDAVVPKAEEPRFEAPLVALAVGDDPAKADVDFFVCSATAGVRQMRSVTFPISVRSAGSR
jgi:hypothetical protein